MLSTELEVSARHGELHRAWGEAFLRAVILKPYLSAKVEMNQLETGKRELSKQRKHVQMNGACEDTVH